MTFLTKHDLTLLLFFVLWAVLTLANPYCQKDVTPFSDPRRYKACNGTIKLGISGYGKYLLLTIYFDLDCNRILDTLRQ